MRNHPTAGTLDMAANELVLLVNDIPDHTVGYIAALVKHGFDVQLARTGQDALRYVRALPPHCAVIDLRLPDMSGWELCRQIKAHPDTQPTRIIVLTPEVSRTGAAASAEAGCAAWLTRPSVPDDLVHTVRRVLDRHTDHPASAEEALIGLLACPACADDSIRATVRVGAVQYYACRSCGFCWRAERL